MIEFHIAERRAGKTHRLAQWAAATGGVVVCHDEMAAEHLRRFYGVQAVSVYSAAATNLRGRGGPPVAVDNADILLEQMLGTDIARVSATGVRQLVTVWRAP